VAITAPCPTGVATGSVAAMAKIVVGALAVSVQQVQSTQDAGRIAAEAVQYGAASASVAQDGNPQLYRVTVEFPAGQVTSLLAFLAKFSIDTVGDPHVNGLLRTVLGVADDR
jgi:hypothetical protein